ncbi:MAG: hypothetical protein KKH44_06790 [Bacteroidetes bacterium]|nr:hypothetical protein [Bacteroidota bacterium]
MSKIRPLHFLLRYSDKLSGKDTIAEHRAILNGIGSVLLGKFGVGASTSVVGDAIDQISAGVKCYLYLMTGGSITHRCRIIDVQSSKKGGLPFTPKTVSLIPDYYRSTKCKLWFELNKIDDYQVSISNFYLYNSVQERPSIRGMRGLVYITTEMGPEKITIKCDTIDPSRDKLLTGSLFD